MSRKDNIQRLVSNHTRRLQGLKEKKALLGYSTDPSIDAEIEDTEAKIEKLRAELKGIDAEAAPSSQVSSTTHTNNPTIRETIDNYLETISNTRSLRTFKIYRTATEKFIIFLQEKCDIDVNSKKATCVQKEWLANFLADIQDISLAQRKQYSSAIKGWYRLLRYELEVSIDLESIGNLARPHLQETNPRPPIPPPTYHDISKLIDYAMKLSPSPHHYKEEDVLTDLRDRALILTLADTDLNVASARALRCGEIDWENKHFNVSEGGINQEYKFTQRVVDALTKYLKARLTLDKSQNSPLDLLPVFARHDKRAFKKVLPITTDKTVQNTVRDRGSKALGDDYRKTIRPTHLRRYQVAHSLFEQFNLLHYKIARATKAQYENGQYEDAIFRAMEVIENEVRDKTTSDLADRGAEFISKVMGNDPPTLKFSEYSKEQKAADCLYRGAIDLFKESNNSRFVKTPDPARAYECIAFASLLMRMLDEVI